MENTEALKRFAWSLRGAALVIAVVIPALALIAVISPGGAVTVDAGPLPAGWAAGAALVVGLTIAAAMVSLARMLAVVARGAVFEPEATRHFRRFALWLLAAAVARMVLPVLIQGLLIAVAGARRLVVSIDDADAVVLLVSVLLFFVARLFDEAARIAEENRSIV